MASTRGKDGAGKVPPDSSPLKDAIYTFSTQCMAFSTDAPPCPRCCEKETKLNDSSVYILPRILLCYDHRLTAQQDTFCVSMSVVEEEWVPKIIDWLANGVKGQSQRYPWELDEYKHLNFFHSLCKYAGWFDGINDLIVLTHDAHDIS